MRFSDYKLFFGLFVVANQLLRSALALLIAGRRIIYYYHMVKVIYVSMGLSISEC